MSGSTRALLKRWIKEAEQQGWTVSGSGGSHLKWRRPDGTVAAVTGCTPGEGRAAANTRAMLRRVGLRGIR